MKWLIKSTTRTGSHLIYNLLQASGLRAEHVSYARYQKHKSPPVYPYLANHEDLKLKAEDDNIVVHDHTTWLPPDTENWNIVYAERQDKPAQTLSSIAAGKINEYLLEGLGSSTYTDKYVSPFYLDPKATLISHRKRIHYENNLMNLCKSFQWRSSYLFYFEDLIQASPDMIAHIFQIEYDKAQCNWDKQKNPRKVKDIIINYNSLYNDLQADECDASR